jgi:uncharacterized membrane protein
VDAVRRVSALHGRRRRGAPARRHPFALGRVTQGKRHEFDAEISDQRPDERIAWKTTDGTSHAGTVTFKRLDDTRCTVTVQMDWQPEGMLEELGAAIGSDDRRVKADLESFKEMIESRGGESGAWRGTVKQGESR